MSGVSAGRRDRVITIQQLQESKGKSGFPKDKWTTLASVKAGKSEPEIDSTLRERFIAGQLSGPLQTTWTIAYRPDMDPNRLDVSKIRRVLYAGRVYDIQSAREVGRRGGIELLTLAKAA